MERITYQDMPNGMFDAIRNIENFIAKSSLDTQLMNLIKLRVSQINGCAYCVDMHHKELKHQGEDDLRLALLCVWEETHYFSPKEECTLRFAEETTVISHKPISSEIFDSLLNHYSKEEIAYLSLAIAQINTWNRLMKIFQTEPGKFKVGENT